MPVNGYTLGSDVRVDFVDPAGGLISFDDQNGMTGFSAKQDTTKDETRILMGGTLVPIIIPGGWSGEIMLDRRSAIVDRYFAQREATYHAGAGLPSGTITETIAEQDGTVSQFRYDNVMMKYDDAGTAKGDDVRQLKLSWRASARVLVV